MCNKVGLGAPNPLTPPLFGNPFAQQPFGDPLEQLRAMLGQVGQAGGTGPLDINALKNVIRQLDRQIVERLLQGGGQGLCGPQPPMLPQPQPICAPPPPVCAPPPCAIPQQPQPQAPAPKPQPSKIKKGKEWQQGMIDASGKAIPKPPREGSNAHFDKNGNFKKWTSPLTFDLNGNGKVGTTDVQNGRKFDINGDGKVDQTAWAEKGDGVLAFDRDGNGVAGENGKELFGNVTDIGDGKQYGNGFDALKALAKTKLGEQAVADGKLDARELRALERTAAEGGVGLTMLVDGKRVKPTEIGMSEINLGYQDAGQNPDENGNQHRQIGAGFVRNGQKGAVDDVWFGHT
jgi:hypothetical protein